MDVWWITALYLMTLNAARCPTSSWNIILSSDRLYSWFSWKLYYIYYTNLLHKHSINEWMIFWLKFHSNFHEISISFLPFSFRHKHVDNIYQLDNIISQPLAWTFRTWVAIFQTLQKKLKTIISGQSSAIDHTLAGSCWPSEISSKEKNSFSHLSFTLVTIPLELNKVTWKFVNLSGTCKSRKPSSLMRRYGPSVWRHVVSCCFVPREIGLVKLAVKGFCGSERLQWPVNRNGSQVWEQLWRRPSLPGRDLLAAI